MPVPPVFNEAEVGSDPDVAPNKTLDLVARLLDSDASTATSASVSSGSAPADKFSTDGTTTVEKAAYGIIGAVTFIILGFSIFLFIRRRNKKRKKAEGK